MRPLLGIFSILAIAAAGCGDPDAGKLVADVQYATRCPTSNHCAGSENRDICGINNGDPCIDVEGTARVSCSVSETSDGANYLVNFSADQGQGFAISLRNAQVSKSGGFAGGANCAVRVSESPNVYEGRCGSGDPSPAQPCQVSGVEFVDDMGTPTLQGTVLCRDLPSQSNPMLVIDVTQIGTGTAANLPGRFRIANCVGLTL